MTTSQSPIKIAILGACGRMGRMLMATVLDTPAAELIAAIDSSGNTEIGTDAGTLVGKKMTGITVTGDMNDMAKADAVIDFTIPSVTAKAASVASEKNVAHIIGTTGLNKDETQTVLTASQKNQIVWAPNYSAGVTLLMHLTQQAAAALDDEFDIEILEMHHKHKIDAPSGTALSLGQAAARGRDVSLDTHGIFTREGQTGERKTGSIGFATLRGGDVIGDHTVMFAAPEERLELTHKAQNRNVFSAGAVRAALWAVHQPAGLYDMTDVLGLKKA